jgi:glycosyltransferase involved in cell wall biosynthesis
VHCIIGDLLCLLGTKEDLLASRIQSPMLAHYLRDKSLRLTIVQYAGDYREAFERFARGGKETYYAQRYSVNMVGSLAQRLEQVAVVCGLSDEEYDVVLDNGVRAIGAGLAAGFHPRELVNTLSETRPTRLALMAPMVPLLKWAKSNRVRTIVPLADSFQKCGFREGIRRRRLAYYLNKPFVDWIGNHGINACLSLADIGVNAQKIVPWDWPPSHRPTDYQVRTLRPQAAYKLLYVGSVIESKGVGDLLQAVAHLRQCDVKVELSIIGKDPDGAMTALAQSLKVENIVRFVGMVPNEEIPEAMRGADIVVIPSRHEYPEGLPLTIYEALSARTPIVASDHPMFRGTLVDGQSAVIFRGGRADELALAIDRLLRSPALYESLSLESADAWSRIQLPVSMGKLLEAWVSGDPEQKKWINDHRLMSGCYEQRIKERRAILQEPS